MTTSHDLRKALDYFDEMGGSAGPLQIEVAFDCLNEMQQQAIIDAARCWLDLTSEENVEIVAAILGGKSARIIGAGDGARRAARAVLVAVEGGTDE